jgi:hypothetical protein
MLKPTQNRDQGSYDLFFLGRQTQPLCRRVHATRYPLAAEQRRSSSSRRAMKLSIYINFINYRLCKDIYHYQSSDVNAWHRMAGLFSSVQDLLASLRPPEGGRWQSACAGYFHHRTQTTGTIVLNPSFFARMKDVDRHAKVPTQDPG